MSVAAAASSAPSRAALRANALRSLIDQGVGLRNPSIAPSTIISVDPNFLVVEFPASEFMCMDGSILREKLAAVAHCVSKASVEMMMSDTTSGTGRQSNFSAQLFEMPGATETIRIRGKSTQDVVVNFYQLEFMAAVKRNDVWIRVADGTSTLILDPIPQVQAPTQRKNRRPMKASARDSPNPTAPDAPVGSAQQQQQHQGTSSAAPASSQPPAAVPPVAPAAQRIPLGRRPVKPMPGLVFAARPPPPPPASQLVQEYMGAMDTPIQQRYMLTNVRTTAPEFARTLLNQLSDIGVTPSNITHSPMFMSHSLHSTFVFYYDVEDANQRAIVERSLAPERNWFRKFDAFMVRDGEKFMAYAIPMKIHLVTTLIATWLHETALRAAHLQNRSRAVASPDVLRTALCHEEKKKNIVRLLTPDGRRMMQLLKR